MTHVVQCILNVYILARSCGNPGVPYNGFKHGSAHTYGKNVTYTCQQGYTLVGHRMRTCDQSTAKWTGSLPSCNCKYSFG
jgi:CUB/sushi domain-containing protein